MTGRRRDTGALEHLRDLIEARYGLAVDDMRRADLAAAIERRATRAGLDPAGYVRSLDAGDTGRLESLAAAVTVGETYFFRNPEHFAALAERVLPERMRVRRRDAELRILSAGCSSGEEPYSIAMLAREVVTDPHWRVTIRAVDLNPRALGRAAAGVYPAYSTREIPARMARRWFVPKGRQFCLSPRIRDAVDFGRANISDAGSDIWRPGSWDVIFCRNVIMYLRPEVRRQVVACALEALVDGGYIFLGDAETMRGLSDGFDLVCTGGTFYYQRRRRQRGKARPLRSALQPEPKPQALAVVAPQEAPAATSPALVAQGAVSIPTGVPAQGPDDRPVPPAADRVRALLRQERFADALAAVEAMPALPAGESQSLLLQATILADLGRFAAAGEISRRLLERDQGSAAAHHVLGLCLEGVGDRPGALALYREAARLDTSFAMPVLRAGLLVREASGPDAAASDLDRAAGLLREEDPDRLLLFGGGFSRQALIALCAGPSAIAKRAA